jgi:hypothetical protein
MTTKREEMKAMRLKAMGVVGEQTQANIDMFQRVIAAGSDVAAARTMAETAQMGALNEQVADLNEMAAEMEEFAQAANPTGSAAQSTGSVAPTVKPSTGSAALAALMAAQPNPPAEKQTITPAEVGNVAEVLDGNAYHGTAPPKL